MSEIQKPVMMSLEYKLLLRKVRMCSYSKTSIVIKCIIQFAMNSAITANFYI